MPGLGDPLVREMRRIAAAHAAFPGQPPSDPEELIESYESGSPATGSPFRASGISRREFLRRGAAVGVGVVGATALGWSRARRVFAQEANVVIVGAGLGGLTCAYRLMRHGIASTLWESRDRVGGRCWSIRVFDNAQTAEHGGQYIDTRHRQIRNLARELNVLLVDTEAQSFPAGAGDYFWFDGAFHTRDEIFADFPLVLDRLKKDYQQAGRYFYNQAGPDALAFDRLTVNDWLDQNVPGGLTSLLAQAIERSNTGFWGLDGDQLSAINLSSSIWRHTRAPTSDSGSREGTTSSPLALRRSCPPAPSGSSNPSRPRGPVRTARSRCGSRASGSTSSPTWRYSRCRSPCFAMWTPPVWRFRIDVGARSTRSRWGPTRSFSSS